MPYGINSASEVVQLEIADIIDGIENAENSQDDTIIWRENQEQHDQNVRKVLNRIRANGIKVNKKKYVFSVPELIFLGHVISKDGIKVDPKKVEATIRCTNNEKNDQFYRKVAFLMYSERVNFRPQSWKEASKLKPHRGLGTRLPSP